MKSTKPRASLSSLSLKKKTGPQDKFLFLIKSFKKRIHKTISKSGSNSATEISVLISSKSTCVNENSCL
jgi:hypothetical protein